MGMHKNNFHIVSSKGEFKNSPGRQTVESHDVLFVTLAVSVVRNIKSNQIKSLYSAKNGTKLYIMYPPYCHI